ncbi:hypothetical protein PLICRDRAFT_537570 [Plicaturopsis crispa FD-325 SS-3]|nr:hypothetical protein PLICRDRAFT_537570 [Plicaturopsis crispa FD-325 SS-3]
MAITDIRCQGIFFALPCRSWLTCRGGDILCWSRVAGAMYYVLPSRASHLEGCPPLLHSSAMMPRRYFIPWVPTSYILHDVDAVFADATRHAAAFLVSFCFPCTALTFPKASLQVTHFQPIAARSDRYAPLPLIGYAIDVSSRSRPRTYASVLSMTFYLGCSFVPHRTSVASCRISSVALYVHRDRCAFCVPGHGAAGHEQPSRRVH